MTIEDIQTLVAADAIHWTDHVAKRLIKRRISPDEVLETLRNGRVYGRQDRTKEGSEKLYEITEQIIKKHVEKGNLK